MWNDKGLVILSVTCASSVGLGLIWWCYDQWKKQDDEDRKYMELAIEQANQSRPVETAFCVGCVIVENGQVISTGYSREMAGNTHAEQCALLKLEKKVGEKAVMYTTMEPCSERLSKNKSCTARCLEAGIKRVVIGVLEPDVFVQCKGISLLKKHRVRVKVLKGLEQACLKPNQHVLKPF